MHTKEYLSLLTNLLRNIAFCALMDSYSERLPNLVKTISFEYVKSILPSSFINKDEDLVQAMLNELAQSASVEQAQLMGHEMLICRNVEAFDYYITQMLRKIFTQRSEILKNSNYSIKMNEILQCNSIEEIIKHAVENKVQELGYKGLSDIVQYLNSQLGLKLDANLTHYQGAVEVFLARNLIVHNSSIINEVYIQKTGKKYLDVGNVYPVTEDYFIQATASLIKFGATLDEKFVSHFKLV